MPYKFERSEPTKRIRLSIESDDPDPRIILSDADQLPELYWVHPGESSNDVYIKLGQMIFSRDDIILPREIIRNEETLRWVRTQTVSGDLSPNPGFHWFSQSSLPEDTIEN